MSRRHTSDAEERRQRRGNATTSVRPFTLLSDGSSSGTDSSGSGGRVNRFKRNRNEDDDKDNRDSIKVTDLSLVSSAANSTCYSLTTVANTTMANTTVYAAGDDHDHRHVDDDEFPVRPSPHHNSSYFNCRKNTSFFFCCCCGGL